MPKQVTNILEVRLALIRPLLPSTTADIVEALGETGKQVSRMLVSLVKADLIHVAHRIKSPRGPDRLMYALGPMPEGHAMKREKPDGQTVPVRTRARYDANLAWIMPKGKAYTEQGVQYTYDEIELPKPDMLTEAITGMCRLTRE